MKSTAQKRAEAKYRREKLRQVVVTFSPCDYDLYAWVKSQPSMAGYVKRLIREDLERRG